MPTTSTIRPTADLATVGTWRPATGDASVAAGMDESVADNAGGVSYLRSKLDPPRMIGNGESTAPNAWGLSAAHGVAGARRYSVTLGDSSGFDYEYALLYVPAAALAAPATARPCVVWLHGVTNTEQGLDNDPALMDDWLAEGWLVLSLRQGVTMNDDGTDENDGKFGNNATREACRDLDRWLRRTPWTVDKVLLYGYSAGGIMTVNYLLESLRSPAFVVPVAGAWLMNPLLSIRLWMVAHASKVRPAYGLGNTSTTASADYIANVDTDRGGHDPLLTSLAPGTMPSIPFHIRYDPGDTTVNQSQSAVPWNQRLTDAAWPHSHDTSTHSADHGGGTWVAGTNAFFKACLAGTL